MENNAQLDALPTTPYPPSPSPTNWSKILLFTIIGLTIVTAAVILVIKIDKNQTPSEIVISPTTLPTTSIIATPIVDSAADWKTYSNTAYKYTLKYPSSWEIGAKGDADVTTFSAPDIESPCNYDSGQLCSQIFIETGAYNPEKKFEPNFIIDLTSSKPDKVSSKTITTFDGEEAQEFEYFQSNYGDKGRLLYVLVTNHKNTKYTFTYEESQKGHTFQTKNDWQNKKMFDQILSTFKFTN